ncbi:MAG: MFS transporter [Chloroflexi bacterium]|nr:MFS transporter [Chloroflexota bacterium]
MSLTVEQNRSALAALRIPNFRKLWIGQTISQVGDGLASLALIIVINQVSGSTAALAGITIAIALPQLIFGLLAGVYVDRWDRRRVMIASDILRGLLVLGMVFIRRADQVWIFYILGFAQAAVSAFFDPAKTALLPQILDRDTLLAANSLSQAMRAVTMVIGESLAGVLVGLAGNGWPAFTLDALSFFVSALFIARMVLPAWTGAGVSGGSTRGTLEMLSEGLQFIFGSRLLIGLVVTMMVTMLGIGALNVLFVPFLTRDLQVPTAWLGVIGASEVVGMVLSSALVSTFATRLKTGQILALGVLGVGAFTELVASAHSVILFLIAIFGVGLFMSPIQAASATLLQQNVPAEKRGRAAGALSTVMSLAAVLSMAYGGVLGGIAGIRLVFFISGGIILMAGVLSAFMISK